MDRISIVFLSNYFSHYQKALSDSIYNATGDAYSFVATEQLDFERKKLGWNELDAPYLINASDDEQRVFDLANNADIVVFGAAPIKYIQKRMRDQKLTFIYSERPLKKGSDFVHYIPRLIKYRRRFANNKNAYLLASGAYAYNDYNRMGLFRNKGFCWGYFSEFIKMDIETVIKNKEKNSILWVGRIMPLKHPEDIVFIGKRLKERNIDYRIRVVGTGEERYIHELKQQIEEADLGGSVELLGAMSPAEVREQMLQSEIFLFTSDRREGWGVVVNEAMNSGCVCVANSDAGASKYMIRDREDGYIYKNGYLQQLEDCVLEALSDPEKKRILQIKAYEKIERVWNPVVAGERLVELSKSLLDNESSELFENGPCSRATIMDNK